MRYLSKIMVVVAVACIAMVSMVAHAGLNKNNCVVTNSRDSANASDSIRHAVHWFNKTGEMQYCRNSIGFKEGLEAIPLRQPLIISGPNSATVSDANPRGEFLFGPETGTVTLSISTETFDGQTDTTCAIKISTPNAKIRNIRIQGNSAISNGICVDSSVTLENVQVVNFQGDGIRIGSDATINANDIALDGVTVESVGGSGVMVNENVGRVAIFPNTVIKSAKQGVTFKNGMGMSASSIYGTNRQVDATAGADANGLAQYTNNILGTEQLFNQAFGLSLTTPEGEAAPTEQNFQFSAIKGTGVGVDFVSSNSQTVVQLWKILKGTTDGSYEIKGAVVAWDPTNIPTGKDDEAFCEDAAKVTDLYRLNVYGVSSGNAEFLTYVMQENDEGGMGIRNNSSNLGVFDFVITTTTAQSFQSIIIVPEFLSKPMGSASEIIPLVQTRDFHCPGLAGGSSSSSGNYVDAIVQYSSFRACLLEAGTKPTFSVDQDYDTDGDNIPDWKEMSVSIAAWRANKTMPYSPPDINAPGLADRGNAVCDCTGMVSCWYKKDTDGDGVPDGSINGGELLNSDGTIRDSDGDGTPDALEVDSDGDGVNDGIEDRNKAFKQSIDAFLYDDTSIISGETAQPVVNPLTKAAAKCELNQWASVLEGTPIPGFTPQAIGISYGVYMIDEANGIRSFSTSMLVGGALPEGAHLMRLQCRNATTFGQTNFNGTYDKGYDRSDLRNAGEVALICQPYEILSLMNDTEGKYVDANGMKLDSDGVPILFKQKNEDGTPNWALIQQICPDQDADKIPDCIERWDGQCSTTSANQKQFLNPYTNDSDCDGIADNVDVCPFSNKQLQGDSVALCSALLTRQENGEDVSTQLEADKDDSDKFGATAGYSCDATKVYVNYPTPVISCFFDRDGDQLRDCQEDKDMDGVVDVVIDDDTTMDLATRKANISKEDTNPLTADTDEDGLTDYDELNYSGTNPRLADTDADGLNDKAEVEHGKNELQYDKTTNAAKSCLNSVVDALGNPMGTAALSDTDPWTADSDADGLYDGVEVRIGTNPTNPDSDADTKKDGVEVKAANGDTTGNWPIYDTTGTLVEAVSGSYDFGMSNHCSADSDKDTIPDSQDAAPSLGGTGCMIGDGSGQYGVDFDCDGLPDKYEEDIGTDPNKTDTDGDGLVDGCTKGADGTVGGGEGELCYHVKNQLWTDVTVSVKEKESNPGVMGDTTCPNVGKEGATLKGVYTDTGSGSFCGVQIGIACGSDTDGDGLPDYYENMFGTNPSNPDTDGDGIADGIEAGWVVAKETELGSGEFLLQLQTGKTEYVAGAMTNPSDSDTDEDGLIDGYSVGTNFEDKNCNGRVDTDRNTNPLETDPRSGDSDGDGNPDHEEFCDNGICGSSANVARATTGQRSGCSVGGNGGETWGMTLMFAMMLIATRASVIAVRRAKTLKTRAEVKRRTAWLCQRSVEGLGGNERGLTSEAFPPSQIDSPKGPLDVPETDAKGLFFISVIGLKTGDMH